MPLVIHALGGGDTHTHTHAHTDIHTQAYIRTEVILRNQAIGRHVPGLKLILKNVTNSTMKQFRVNGALSSIIYAINTWQERFRKKI